MALSRYSLLDLSKFTTLQRGISRSDFIALVINITIGAGILKLLAKLYALVGKK